jgi:hypothetical protein
MGRVLAGITISVDGFVFAGSLAGAIDRARAAAGGKLAHVMGGADLIRQALAAGRARRAHDHHRPGDPRRRQAPVRRVRRLPGLAHPGVRQSPFVTFTGYRVKSEGGES